MKNWAFILAIFAVAGLLGACKSTGNNQDLSSERYAKKIYLTKEDYLEDLEEEAALDRRELRPSAESEYIFNIMPQNSEDTPIYFFDKHRQPKVPGEYTANDYKNEKRLWKKPRRYTPEQYYGMQGNDSSGSNSYEENSSYSY